MLRYIGFDPASGTDFATYVLACKNKDDDTIKILKVFRTEEELKSYYKENNMEAWEKNACRDFGISAEDTDMFELAEEIAEESPNLVVAAPDLLAACKAVCDFCYPLKNGQRYWRGDVNMKGILAPMQLVRSAITKAEGKS